MEEPLNNNYTKKKKIIKELLKDIQKKQKKHYKKYAKLKKINTAIRTGINILNSVSVCSLILGLTPTAPIAVIIALSTTTCSGILSSGVTAYQLDLKVHHHNTSYLQYIDLYRDYTARLHINNLSSKDLTQMLSEINSRLGLIEDASLPINESITPNENSHGQRRRSNSSSD